MHSVLTKLGPFAKGLAGAALAWLLLQLVSIAISDHLALQQLATYINTVAPKINKLP
jgi:hypothetical protein